MHRSLGNRLFSRTWVIFGAVLQGKELPKLSGSSSSFRTTDTLDVPSGLRVFALPNHGSASGRYRIGACYASYDRVTCCRDEVTQPKGSLGGSHEFARLAEIDRSVGSVSSPRLAPRRQSSVSAPRGSDPASRMPPRAMLSHSAFPLFNSFDHSLFVTVIRATGFPATRDETSHQ